MNFSTPLDANGFTGKKLGKWFLKAFLICSVFVMPFGIYSAQGQSVSQSAFYCDGSLATMNVTGLPNPNDEYTLTFTVAGGSSQTVNVIADGSGNASFTTVLTTGDNGQLLTISDIDDDHTTTDYPVSISA